jgi:histidyl-tRNA synthetase
MANLSLPPGISDIFPDEMIEWRHIEKTAEKVFSLYGYSELRTPILEYTEIFQRSIGTETDVVKKEMYTFEDKGGRSLTLRPEGTAGVMRALAGTDVMNGNERRVFYTGPMFRGEKPAAGRKRQFYQIGVENAGTVSAEADAESIAMLMHFLKSLGLENASLLINTRGAFEDRVPAEKLLRERLTERAGELCHDCRERMERNIWRVIDCKNPDCAAIVDSLPEITSSFSEETKNYFHDVCTALDVLNVPYKIEPNLVRGLDYYVHTVFEVTHPGLGAQNSIAGGGRYEVSLPGVKRAVVGVGFALGIERIIMARDSENVTLKDAETPAVYFISLGKSAKLANMKSAAELRNAGYSVVGCMENKSMKAQMRAANKVSADFAVIRGEDEVENGICICKNMHNSDQKEIPEGELLEFLKATPVN